MKLSAGLSVAVLTMAIAGCATWSSTQRQAHSNDLLERGDSYLSEGLLESALAAFEMALETNPRLVNAHMGIGDIYRAKGDYATAAERYESARSLEPRSFDANYKLGLMYHLLNRVRDAIQVYLTALTIDPNSFEANLNLATAYLQIGQPQLGLPYAEAAVNLKPDSQAAQVNLGSIYAAMGQYQLAIDAYRAAAELGALEPQIALNLADALIRTGRYRRAINTLEALARQQSSELVYERIGYAYFKLADFDQSARAYEKALELDPDDPASLNGLGVNLMTQYLRDRRENIDLRDRAIRAWQQSVRIKPDQQRIIDLIARYRGL